jgi:non-reducing end alpha-L-arabinofuranosidase
MKSRALLLSLVLAGAAGGIAATATSAQAAAGCRVDYTVTNSWSGGFGAAVTITNLGDPINGWQLSWSYTAGQTVTQLWNGSVQQSGSQVTVTNASYNGAIATGGSANFGFNGAWIGSNPAPAGFVLNGTSCTGGTVPSSPPPSCTTAPDHATADHPTADHTAGGDQPPV